MIRPKNAYEAWMMAADSIEAHPLNYCQAWFSISVRSLVTAPAGPDLVGALKNPANECGTAFCRAGWMALKTLGEMNADGLLKIDEDRIGNLGGWGYVVRVLSRSALGTVMDDELDTLTGALSVSGQVATPEYVKGGADGTRRFAEQWREHLESVVYTYDESDNLSNYAELKARLIEADQPYLDRLDAGRYEDDEEPTEPDDEDLRDDE